MKPRKNENLWIDGLTKEQTEEAKKKLHEWLADKEGESDGTEKNRV